PARAPVPAAGCTPRTRWLRRSGDRIASFTILTCAPNNTMAPIHDRMPVIIDAADHNRWLDPACDDVAAIRDLLGPCPDTWLTPAPSA
ncbi:MAG: SOS response-associated peptidase family protein, partial [Planctomycetota bacterium]